MFALLITWDNTAYGYDWLQFNGDPQHSGNNTQEEIINTGNVGTLHVIFKVTLPDIADGAPVYLSNVSTSSGTEDLIFVTTLSGYLIAMDAHTGEQVWIQQNPPGSCKQNMGSQPCYTTSSPAIDLSREYVYAYGLDGSVHKYNVGDGAEILDGGWPEVATLKPFSEKGSSNLSIAQTADGSAYLYATHASYADKDDYQGHITAIDLASGSQTVFNSLCSNQAVHFVEKPGSPDCAQVQSGVWAREGVVYDSDSDRILIGTGNGPFRPKSFDWGDSILALRPDGTTSSGTPLDSYTPVNYQFLQSTDEDLGSTAPAILPTPKNSAIPHLAVQSGKDGMLRLLNLDNLSGSHGPGHIGGEISLLNVPQGGAVRTAPAVWVNPEDESTWIFVADGAGISGLKLTITKSGSPRLLAVWKNSNGGTSPIVANGVLYYAGNKNMRALNPVTGKVLWQYKGISTIHWESPIVANGMLFITDNSANLTAFAPGQP